MNARVVQRLAACGRDIVSLSEGSVRLVHSFCDTSYNRTSYYLLGRNRNIIQPVLKLCEAAYEMIDFGIHTGKHPTLGSVDHICFYPLGNASLDSAVDIAKEFTTLFHSISGVPVYTYGVLSPHQRRLQHIRRQLRYFDQSKLKSSVENVLTSENDSAVDLSSTARFVRDSAIASSLHPDFGHPDDINERKGLTCIGTVPLVRNYNLRFRVGDAKASIVPITKALRQADIVEALTLPHGDGCYEIACNLLQPHEVTPEIILQRAQELARTMDLEIVSAYTTGPTEEELLSNFTEEWT